MRIDTTMRIVDLDEERRHSWRDVKRKSQRLLVFLFLDLLMIAAIIAIAYWS